MDQIQLLDSTNNVQVDQLWRDIIGLFETTFPDRISGYYVTGSHATGTAIPTSDVDGVIVFRHDFIDRAEFTKAWQLLQHYMKGQPSQFDCILAREQLVFFYGSRFVKFNSKLLYGADIRDRIELRQPNFDARAPISVPFVHMAQLRGNPKTLTAPLHYPDPDGEFYGYDCRTIRTANDVKVASMKAVPVCVGWCATTILDRMGVVVEGKQDCLPKYKAHIGDAWTPFLAEVESKIRKGWHYLIPEDRTARRELRRLCKQTLAFENHYLILLRGFLLEELDPEIESGWWMPVSYADWYGFSVEEIQRDIHDSVLSYTDRNGY